MTHTEAVHAPHSDFRRLRRNPSEWPVLKWPYLAGFGWPLTFEAMRRAVEDQIIAFRDAYFAGAPERNCPLRGIPITPSAYHVDHAPPEKFLILAETWLGLNQLTFLDVRITPPGDNQIVARMTDEAQMSSWFEFHRSRAVLRMLSPLGNLSNANRRVR